MKPELRVLSIQSHVVHGYCGNKCAVFPLQLHGVEVDAINSVQFSNHTAYKGGWKGVILEEDQLWDIYQGLKINKINSYSHLLTGYVGSESVLRRIADILNDLRQEDNNLLYICDPVMGDNGAYYVSEDVLPVYHDTIIPMAAVITPNQFELQVLSGIAIDSQTSLIRAICTLHDRGPGTVIVTSTTLAPSDDVLYGYGSEVRDNGISMFRFEVRRLPAVFFGTGDLFASLLLVWLQKTDCLKSAVERAVSCLQDVLNRTFTSAQSESKLDCSSLELRLIHCSEEILDPKSKVVMIDL